MLAWRSHDVATACELPVVGPAPCINMALASRDAHVLHQFPYDFPYDEQLTSRSPEGWASIAPGRRAAPHRSPVVNWCRRSRPQ
ncbi:hypothetical protein ABWJ92_36220 [Streptomyces sp. NPDC000609]|uniref:hypothetical protein n=1 Tax=Streptomyces sp. NPDC000609 TaxID=3160957 RepID=UPI0033975F28